MKNLLKTIEEFSLTLIAGIATALVWANLDYESYHYVMHHVLWGNEVSLHFLVNDVFMVLFFAVAAVEIVNSMSSGGSLHPLNKAAMPLLATAGGVVGPVAVFFLLNGILGEAAYINGWGITAATDIAIAWLVAKLIFGAKHPAVDFLLLLAVVDDAIGLVIIAVFYSDPEAPTEPIWLIAVAGAVILAACFNKVFKIKGFLPYLLICGSISWLGMYNANLHPALAFVFIVPFLPRTGKVLHQVDMHGTDHAEGVSALHSFEDRISPIVDYGLFFFGLANAGVALAQMSSLTWIILASIVLGKTAGIFLFTMGGKMCKLSLPEGMHVKDVLVLAVIGGIGLTVALFVADAAFTDIALQGAAKMGALFTVVAGIVAAIIGKIFKVKQ